MILVYAMQSWTMHTIYLTICHCILACVGVIQSRQERMQKSEFQEECYPNRCLIPGLQLADCFQAGECRKSYFIGGQILKDEFACLEHCNSDGSCHLVLCSTTCIPPALCPCSCILRFISLILICTLRSLVSIIVHLDC